MKKQTLLTLFALITLGILSVSAMAQSTHSVWTNDNGLVIRDAETGCKYDSLRAFDMATSWTEPAPPNYPAVAHFRGVSKAYASSPGCRDHDYEFRLVRTAAATNDDIVGYWNVYRSGTLMCNLCKGTAYGLSQPVGNYYKVYVDDPIYGPATWLYSGYIDARKDF
ncbi:MAG TPA: hypothetical protein VK400_10655 [Pyrinomonadaceae bacterium]|nr:hypothetical protein [Pyrinomonadaceae bacterium]